MPESAKFSNNVREALEAARELNLHSFITQVKAAESLEAACKIISKGREFMGVPADKDWQSFIAAIRSAVSDEEIQTVLQKRPKYRNCLRYASYFDAKGIV